MVVEAVEAEAEKSRTVGVVREEPIKPASPPGVSAMGKDEGESAPASSGGAVASLWSAASGAVPGVVELEARKPRTASVPSVASLLGEEDGEWASAAATCDVAASGASIPGAREVAIASCLLAEMAWSRGDGGEEG